jgi:hypothetical protein
LLVGYLAALVGRVFLITDRYLVRRLALPALGIRSVDVTPQASPSMGDDLDGLEIPEWKVPESIETILDPTSPPSAALRFWLAADELLPHRGRGRSARSRRVPVRQLTAGVFVATFWSLMDEGAISLDGSRVVRRKHIPMSGFEGAILDLPSLELDIYIDADTTKVPGFVGNISDIVAGCVPLSADPYWKVMTFVVNEAKAHSLLVPGRLRLRVDTRRLSEMRSECRDWVANIHRFQGENRALYKRIMKECKKAIRWRTDELSESVWSLPFYIGRTWHRWLRPWPRCS